jgi:hypothetical protein
MVLSESWYASGLRFECTGCGRCCRGHGLVELSDADIARLATGLDLGEAEFRERYTRPLRKGRIGLIDHLDGDCALFDREARRCSVHSHRPEQCRAYPFWPSVLHSRQTWAEEAVHCEGIGHGPLHDADELRRWLGQS